MNEWISVKEGLPEPRYKDKDISWYVWVTDGKMIEIAQYIHRPRNYGCAIDDDEERATCGPEPHWHPETEIEPFIGGDKCFGRIENAEITHWMPLPNPPKD